MRRVLHIFVIFLLLLLCYVITWHVNFETIIHKYNKIILGEKILINWSYSRQFKKLQFSIRQKVRVYRDIQNVYNAVNLSILTNKFTNKFLKKHNTFFKRVGSSYYRFLRC